MGPLRTVHVAQHCDQRPHLRRHCTSKEAAQAGNHKDFNPTSAYPGAVPLRTHSSVPLSSTTHPNPNAGEATGFFARTASACWPGMSCPGQKATTILAPMSQYGFHSAGTSSLLNTFGSGCWHGTLKDLILLGA